MKKKPLWLKKLGKAASESYSEAKAKVADIATDVDGALNLSKAAKHASEKTSEVASNLNEKLEVTDGISRGLDAIRDSVQETKDTDIYNHFRKVRKQAREYLRVDLAQPVGEFLEAKGVSSGAQKLAQSTVNAYGSVRSYVKPYYAPETPEELLVSTKEELIYLNACILQVSRDEAEELANRFGAAIASKLAGAATVGTLLGLVSAFGSAGTGTAIASLSGAAATNATLAWVGGLLGGGMATGALLTGGVALAVGVGVYKILGSDARQIEDLSEYEVQVVESTGFLIAAINDILEDDRKTLLVDDAKKLLDNTLRPMHELLVKNADMVAANLDSKNAIAFKQHAIVDFEKKVINGFEYWIQDEAVSQIKNHVEFAIAGVIYALITQTAIDDSPESQLALDAIRRVRSDWAEASEAEISSVISSYSKEQLAGLANNAKGIYHEMLFVKEYNLDHSETYAELHADTNHAGSDVVIRSRESGEVVDEFQLKASSSNSVVNEHFHKYPDIDLLATNEIALNNQGIQSSGISNEAITEEMNLNLDALAANSISDRSVESALIAAAGHSALKILNGERAIGALGGDVLKTAGIAGTSTALVAYLYT